MIKGSFPQAGFFFQNHIAAQKILEMIELGSTIRTITLENYEKGPHIDDVIVETDGGTTFYQIKWSDSDDSAFTIHNLITPPSDKKKALLKELAEGFSTLKRTEGTEVILYSTKKASRQSQPKSGVGKSLSNFIAELHEPLLSSDEYKSLEDLPNFSEYETILQKMQMVSGLDDASFFRFLKVLRLRLGEPDLENQRERVLFKMGQLGIEARLYEHLLTAIVEWSISGRTIGVNDVLQRLRLSERLLDSVVQNFRVEKEFLVQKPDLQNNLEQSIADLPGGFILLEGPPGSGKSTFLTTFRENNPKVKFAYYCFVPQEATLGNRRLEKETFLRSICLAIINSFPGLNFPYLYSEDYEFKLPIWLEMIGALGEKVVFIVDGIDHVDKMKDVLDSPVTAYLDGDPGENVFFVLSSQYIEALGARIRPEIESDPRRRLSIGRFGADETGEFVRRRGLKVDSETLQLIHERSEGIPLYLHYITAELLDLPSNDYLYQKRLSELPVLEKVEIDTYHEFLYRTLEGNEHAVWMLSILAHRREYTSPETLEGLLQLIGVLSDRLRIEQVLARFRHVLRSVEERGFSIFHNSFREFLLRKTSSLSAAINDAIIRFYRANPGSDEAYRNYFRHLSEKGEYAEILKACDSEWLDRSWASFRPSDEITANLHHAWDASIKVGSIKEFIRIAFLEQKFGRIIFNLEYTETYKSSIFLLHIGKVDEAVRTVWDGERITVDAEQFYEFLLVYAAKMEIPVAERIAQAGFDQFPSNGPADEMTLRARARALYDPWAGLFAEVSQYRWKDSDRAGNEGAPRTEEQNLVANNEIKSRIIDTIFSTGSLIYLFAIATSHSESIPVLELANLRAIQLLIRSGRPDDVKQRLTGSTFAALTRSDLNALIVSLAEAGLLEEAKAIEADRFPAPDLGVGLLKKDADFGIKEAFVRLYDDLRVHFLKRPSDVNAYQMRAQAFTRPEGNYLSAMISLASLWCENVKGEVSPRNRADRLKGILTEICVDQEVRQEATREFYVTGDHYLRRDIHKILVDVFLHAAKLQSPSLLEEIVSHWLALDSGSGSYDDLRTNVVFARLLHKEHGNGAKHLTRQLLERAESQARSDEETLRLLEQLSSCAEAYGSCGFFDHAERIRDEMFIIACGVYDRKDYQFSSAIDALRDAHETHPELSLGRLKTLLVLAHQLKGAADGRAVSRALGDLVDFSGRISPSLALEILAREDWAYTDEVIEDFTHSLVATPDLNLRFLWAIVKTMAKWEDYRSYNEDTYPALLSFFSACIARDEVDLVEEIYAYARRQLLIEKGMPERIFEFADAAIKGGLSFSSIIEDRDQYVKPFEEARRKKEESQSGPLARRSDERTDEAVLPSFEELSNLFDNDFEELERVLESISESQTRDDMKRELGFAYDDLGEGIDRLAEAGFVKREALESRSLSSRYRDFTTAILSLPGSDPKERKQNIESLFKDFVDEFVPEFGSADKRKDILFVFNFEAWLTRLSGRTRPIYSIDREFQEKYLPQLLAKTALADLPRIESIIRKYADRSGRRGLFVELAERFSAFDRNHAEDLLDEVEDFEKEFFFSGSARSLDAHLTLLFELNPGKAKRSLLTAFYKQYKAYPKDIVYYLEKVLRFADRFGESDIADYSYRQFEEYNRLLTLGLRKKDVDYEWLDEFPLDRPFPEATIRYLFALFDYPEVGIRKLALASLFEILVSQPTCVDACFDVARGVSANAREHLISVLHSIALYDHRVVLNHKDRLLELAEGIHFNIDQGIKEILEYCRDMGGEFTPGEKARIDSINTVPLLAVPVVQEGLLMRGRNFIPAPNQATALYNMVVRSRTDSHLEDKVYTRIQNLGYEGLSGMDEENRMRRQHNMNSNWDTIEIAGAYHQDVQKVLNETLTKEIKLRTFRDEDVQTLKRIFRLYDPSDLLTVKTARPNDLSWIDLDIGDSDFLNFADADRVSSNGLHESGLEWITLYQEGSQRTASDYSTKVPRATYFRVVTFLSDRMVGNASDPAFALWLAPYRDMLAVRTQNGYRHELKDDFAIVPPVPVSGVKQVIGFSTREFRGQDEPSPAMLLPEYLRALGVEQEEVFSLNYSQPSGGVVEFLEWQEPYDQGRRRQKPLSAGTLLRVKKRELEEHLNSTGQALWAMIELKRTIDQHKPEEEMHWEERTLIRAVFP